MATLLFRLDGPLQSWGTDSKFENRRTEMIPTKSGIIGLLAAACGRKRDADISDLRKLHIGIRTDKPGVVIVDFHNAGTGTKKPYLTRRYYLSDAAFTVGIESNDLNKLLELKECLEHPEYPLFLGRRSCPPGLPLSPTIDGKKLEEALLEWVWEDNDRKTPEIYSIYLEGKSGSMLRRMVDEPVSFDFHHRQYELRTITEKQVKNPNYTNQRQADLMGSCETTHDAFEEV